ncbi:MAG: hypothetical protein H7176_14685 [Bdellovibrionales bacterium]|nr:hypothetical protein [Massilia sp.]
MSIVKNMEVVFVAALVLAGFTTYAMADVRPAPPTAAKIAAQISTGDKVATVIVTTKRLTASEKARLGS